MFSLIDRSHSHDTYQFHSQLFGYHVVFQSQRDQHDDKIFNDQTQQLFASRIKFSLSMDFTDFEAYTETTGTQVHDIHLNLNRVSRILIHMYFHDL